MNREGVRAYAYEGPRGYAYESPRAYVHEGHFFIINS